MTRQDFLSTLGLGAVFVLTTNCLSSCTKDNSTSAAVDFTLDLSDPANAALATKGNYVVRNGAVVARTTNGDYVAATVTCSHQGQPQVTYDKSANAYYCTAHGARFSLQGSGLNANGSGGLTIYKTTLTGTILRVYA
ncbi:MAG: Rieske 2Fe-2S domain-containing protein [Bacteroidota bacterium]|uniref:Rieske 2Fe-2S domain-containing protein n=1 Tax=Runella sp. TaxID=1960881 RepID=UPI0030168B70